MRDDRAARGKRIHDQAFATDGVMTWEARNALCPANAPALRGSTSCCVLSLRVGLCG